MKWQTAVFAIVFLICSYPIFAQDTNAKFDDEGILAPACLQLSQPLCTPADLDKWVADLQHWRFEHRIRMGFDDSYYRNPALQWTQSSFIQPQMMVEDRAFYDPVNHRYTVDRYLDDLQKRYGGIDAVLIWHTYPNIGIDNRNQYDMLRAMPAVSTASAKWSVIFIAAGCACFFRSCCGIRALVMKASQTGKQPRN